jgi:predicted small secreted protein
VAIGVVFMMVGCNTMRGIGEDVEKAGEAIQRSTR